MRVRRDGEWDQSSAFRPAGPAGHPRRARTGTAWARRGSASGCGGEHARGESVGIPQPGVPEGKWLFHRSSDNETWDRTTALSDLRGDTLTSALSFIDSAVLLVTGSSVALLIP